MAMTRTLYLLRSHAGIKHSAFFSFVLPVIAGTIALGHASVEPIQLRSLNVQWEEYVKVTESAKTGDLSKFKNADYLSLIH